MPGSLGNEALDARTFAWMGAEFLKNDDCGVVYADAAKDYGAMERAIAAVPGVAMIHSVKVRELRVPPALSMVTHRGHKGLKRENEAWPPFPLLRCRESLVIP